MTLACTNIMTCVNKSNLCGSMYVCSMYLYSIIFYYIYGIYFTTICYINIYGA